MELTALKKYAGLIFFAALAISGCGGGNGGIDGTGVQPSNTVEISGIAALGAPIANATVTVKAANGTKKSAITGADGKFKAIVTDLPSPYLLRVGLPNGNVLYSVAANGGTTNIHPFTDLIVRNWFKGKNVDINAEFAHDLAIPQLPTADQVNAIKSAIQELFALILSKYNLPADFDLFSSAFDANGAGFDNLLDHIDIVIINNMITINVNDPVTNISSNIVTNVGLDNNFTQTDTMPPTQVVGVRVVPASDKELIVLWDPATDNVGVAGYHIYRRGLASPATTPFPVLSDTGLSANTAYCYQIEAFDAKNKLADKSAEVCGTTLAASAPDITAPAAAQNLQATALNAGTITLVWDESSSPDTVSYEIYRGNNGMVNTKIAVVTITAFTNINLLSSTEYCYTVFAVDAAHNKSVVSNQPCATTPAGVVSNNDFTPPVVLATNPPNTAVGASLNMITATFSESLDSGTVTVNSFKVTGPSGTVSGSVTVSGGVANFVPSTPLAFGSDYQATLTTAIRDIASNQVASDYTWRFNTGKQLALSVDGGNHTCARLQDGWVKCWGINVYGQLGQGDSATRGDAAGEMGANLPVINLGTGRTAVQIVSGRDHVCARLDNSQVKCWGKGSVLGLGSGENRGDAPNEMGDNLPAVDLGTGRIALELVSGGEHNCARLDNGSVKCWGDGIALGLGDTNYRGDTMGEMGNFLPMLDLGPNRIAMALYAGRSHTCVKLDNSEIKCWGYNVSGQLGLGDTNVYGTTPQTVPAKLSALDMGAERSVLTMALGGQHSCAILDNAQLKCWGENGMGELGLGDTADRGDGLGEMGDNLAVVNLGTGRTVIDIAAGYSHNCALLDNGDLKCWGFQGATGVLGYGATYPGNSVGEAPGEMGDTLNAVNVGSNLRTLEVVGGERHTCARLNNGEIKCWGLNGSGQLGLGDTVTRGDQIAEMGDNLPAIDLGP